MQDKRKYQRRDREYCYRIIEFKSEKGHPEKIGAPPCVNIVVA